MVLYPVLEPVDHRRLAAVAVEVHPTVLRCSVLPVAEATVVPEASEATEVAILVVILLCKEGNSEVFVEVSAVVTVEKV